MTPKKALKFMRRIAQDANGCPREIHVEYREAVSRLEDLIERAKWLESQVKRPPQGELFR